MNAQSNASSTLRTKAGKYARALLVTAAASLTLVTLPAKAAQFCNVDGELYPMFRHGYVGGPCFVPNVGPGFVVWRRWYH